MGVTIFRKIEKLDSLIFFKAIKMKAKNIDLDVDYIGGQGSLTDVEEKALSEFFKQRKENLKKAGNNLNSK